MDASSSADILKPSEAAAVRLPLDRASLLPSRVYSSPEIYTAEIDRIFMRNWLPLARVDELPEPGSYFTRTIFDEPVLLVRDKAGKINAFSNVCRHRNRQVAAGAGTCRSDRITCPYHGWSYGLDGRLVSAPFMAETAEFSKEDISLPRLGIDIWQGFVFVNFDVNAEKVSPKLKRLDTVLDPLGLGDMACIDFDRYRAPWNWKVSLENFTEAYHQPLIHPGIDPLVPGATTRYEEVDGPYNLFWIPAVPGAEFQSTMPTIPGTSFHGIWVANVFPIFHLLIDDGVIMWLDWDFRGVEDHDIVWRMLVPRSTLALPDFEQRKSDLYAMIKAVWREDEFACSGVRTGARSRFTTQGRMSSMERSVHQFQNWVLDQYDRKENAGPTP